MEKTLSEKKFMTEEEFRKEIWDNQSNYINKMFELKRDVKELAQKGYSQKDGIKILKEYGYTDSTARMYWKVFGNLNSKMKKPKLKRYNGKGNNDKINELKSLDEYFPKGDKRRGDAMVCVAEAFLLGKESEK